jgi:hypothetical protein
VNTRVPEVLPDGRKLYRTGLPDRTDAWADIDYWDFGNNSFYHGLQMAARKRFSDGLQFQMSYTFGRSVDSVSVINQSDIQENTGAKSPQDAYNVAGHNQGLSDHHVQNHFSFNFSYELPVAGLSGASKALLEGWQLNGIVSLNTGNPYKLNTSSSGNLRDYDEDGEAQTPTPSLVPGASNNPVRADGRDPDQYYDPTAFTLPPPGMYGDLGRNTLIGPGVSTFDLSLFKNTDVAEGVMLQFRAEFFNIFNRTNFGAPNRAVFSGANITPVSCAAYGSPGDTAGCNRLTDPSLGTGEPEPFGFRSDAGRITRSRTSSRQIQVGLRLVF